MNNDRAKEILRLYRPGSRDDQDPEVREALARARQDPELAQWFAWHCSWQSSIQEKMRALPAPAGLKDRILARAPAPGHTQAGRPWRRILPFPASKRLVALAALIVLSLGLVSLWWDHERAPSFADYRARMVSTALRDYRMDMISRNQAEIRDFLKQQSPHGDYELPPRLAQLPGAGAALLTWQGKPVSLVCLDGGGKTLFLFVVKRSDVPRSPRFPQPDFRQVNKMATASWERGNKIYLLAGLEEPRRLSSLISSEL